MSENERLREALRDMIELSMEDNSMWELHETSFRERRRAASNALAAKPDVCVWTHHSNYTYTRSCDGRKTQFIPGSYMNGADFETDTICSGCGRKIEVKGE